MEIKTYTPEQLKEILDAHALWLRTRWTDKTEGSRANLSGADLSRADLSRANLSRADLSRANLSRAYLSDAYLSDAYLSGATLPTGEKWEQYISEVVPALIQAGGRPLAEVCVAEHWDCHDWNNCPMAAAFRCKSEKETPLLLRPRVLQFVQLFDAKLIPNPLDAVKV